MSLVWEIFWALTAYTFVVMILKACFDAINYEQKVKFEKKAFGDNAKQVSTLIDRIEKMNKEDKPNKVKKPDYMG